MQLACGLHLARRELSPRGPWVLLSPGSWAHGEDMGSVLSEEGPQEPQDQALALSQSWVLPWPGQPLVL